MARWPFITALLAVLFAGGCTSVDSQFYRRGIGTSLADQAAVDQGQLQEQYFQYLCRQAGSPDDSCAVGWHAFTEAGMNDIDQRCDAYLAWLDDRRRSVNPILAEMGDAETATHALLFATGAGSTAMVIAAAAFGFARDSFNNANSRLLFEVNHATVQAIVLRNQKRLRDEAQGQEIRNRPDAVYILRQYLRVCMPFTIETEINNTITAFTSGGAAALAPGNMQPLISVEPAGPAVFVRPSVPAAPRAPVASGPTPVRPRPPTDPLIGFIANPSMTVPDADMRRVLGALCVPDTDLAGGRASLTTARIKAFQQYQRKFGGDAVPDNTGKLTPAEISVAKGLEKCDPSKYKNYFEKTAHPAGVASPGLVKILNAALDPDRQLAPDATETEVRSRFRELRQKLAPTTNLRLTGPDFDQQLTLDLQSALTGDDMNGL